MNQTQKAASIWEGDKGKCKLKIEVSGELTSEDIYEQWKGLMEAIGYCMEKFDDE